MGEVYNPGLDESRVKARDFNIYYDRNEDETVEDLMEHDGTKLENKMEELEQQLEILQKMRLNRAGPAVAELKGKIAKITDALVGKTLRESGGDVEKLELWVTRKQKSVIQSEARVNDMPDLMMPGFDERGWLKNNRTKLEREKRDLKIMEAALAKAKGKGKE